MEIKFADTFSKSLDRMLMRETWWYKTYEFFRYDIWRFLGNVWRFRKPLYNHYWWDHHAMLMFVEYSLIHMSKNIENHGLEIDESRLKKVEKMRRAAELIKHYNEDSYIDMAEAELGPLFLRGFDINDFVETGETMDNPLGQKNEKLYTFVDRLPEEQKEHNDKVYNRAREIESSEWNELFEILKGQDYTKFSKKKDFNKQFDGSGIKGWWD